jgi:hypothetical protein
VWRVASDTESMTAFDMAAASLETQRPFLCSVPTAPGPISGLAWKVPASGQSAALIVGHSNNAGLRLFQLSDFAESQQPQARQARASLLATHDIASCKAELWTASSAVRLSLQTLDLEADESSGPVLYQMAFQRSSSLLLLAHSRRKSLIALHIQGSTACQPSNHRLCLSQCSSEDQC